MSKSVFSYPGGKTYLADWVLEHVPQHRVYVEPFCGSASILFNKERSTVEVINDLDDDIVHFFDVLRDSPNELVEWLRVVPYSRSQHERWATEFYNGERSDDPIERAGVFFYLRCSQFASKYRTKSGFSTGPRRNNARTFAVNREQLTDFAERLDHVVIEHKDYADVMESYDAPDSFFYCDPPYVEEGDALYTHGTFDQDRFVATLDALEGWFVCSYTDIPEGLGDYKTVERDFAQFMNTNRPDRSERRVERLVMNFDPDETPRFSGPDQTTLTEATP